MPLMLCPNCNTSMTAVNRQDVEFDMCSACRGVWLDRGELEKLITGAACLCSRGSGYWRIERSAINVVCQE